MFNSLINRKLMWLWLSFLSLLSKGGPGRSRSLCLYHIKRVIGREPSNLFHSTFQGRGPTNPDIIHLHWKWSEYMSGLFQWVYGAALIVIFVNFGNYYHVWNNKSSVSTCYCWFSTMSEIRTKVLHRRPWGCEFMVIYACLLSFFFWVCFGPCAN